MCCDHDPTALSPLEAAMVAIGMRTVAEDNSLDISMETRLEIYRWADIFERQNGVPPCLT